MVHVDVRQPDGFHRLNLHRPRSGDANGKVPNYWIDLRRTLHLRHLMLFDRRLHLGLYLEVR